MQLQQLEDIPIMTYDYNAAKQTAARVASQYPKATVKLPSKNFITDEIADTVVVKALVVEISFGKGITGDYAIYGVTVATLDGVFIHALSKCCTSYKELVTYVASLEQIQE